jgi:hypothetical protein
MRCRPAVTSVLDAERASPSAMTCDAVGLLDAQLLGAASAVSPSAQAAAMNSAGNSSMASGTWSAGISMPRSGRVAHAQVGHRLAADLAARSVTSMSAPMA